MKTLLFPIFISFLFPSFKSDHHRQIIDNQGDYEIIVRGTVAKNLACDIKISIQQFDIDHSKINWVEAIPDENGDFQLTIELPHQRDVIIKFNDKQANLLLMPGDSTYLEITGNNCDNIEFKFADKDQEQLNEFLKWQGYFTPLYEDFLKMAKLSSPEEYFAFNTEQYEDQEESYIKLQESFSDRMKKWTRVHMDVSYGFDLLHFLQFRSMFVKNGMDSEFIQKQYRNELKSIFEKTKENGRISSRYHNFLNLFSNYAMEKVKEWSLAMNKLELRETEINNIVNGLEGYQRDYMISFHLVSMLNSGEVNEIFVKDKMNNVKDAYLRKIVEAKYLDYHRLVKNNMNKDVVLIDYSKKKSNSILDSLRAQHPGDILLVDVWATWCGPCISKFPYTTVISEKYKGENFKVIYLAIKSEINIWENVVKIHNINGYSYLVNEEQRKELVQAIGLGSIPHYFIMDKKGNIIDKAVPDPGDDALIKVLDDLIYK